MVFAVLEAMPDAAFQIEPDGLIINTNTLFSAMFGRQPIECIGTNIYDLLLNALGSPDLGNHLREKTGSVLQAGKRTVFEDDTDIWKVIISPILSPEGGIGSLLVISQDISEQKKSDKRVQKEREIKTTLLDAIPCSATLLDADLHMVAWNRYAHDLLFIGNEAEQQPIGDPVGFFNPEDMEMLRGKFINTLKTGAEDYCELEVRPRGAPRSMWLMVRSQRVILDGSSFVVSIGLDISERKQLEQDLLVNRKRLDYSLKAARAGVWERNLETNKAIWSDSLWELFGIEQGDRQPSLELWQSTVHPDDRALAIRRANEATSRLQELSIEYRVCHPDGTIHWLLSRGMPFYEDDGQVNRYIGTIIEITDRKVLEQALLESKMMHNYALDAAKSGIWEWDVSTDQLKWSDQIWGLYGLEVNSRTLNHQLCVDTVHPDDRETASRIIKEAVSSQNAASLEYRACHSDGSIRWLTSRGMPVLDETGNVSRYIGAIFDITERKQIELELLASRDRLSQALEAARAGVWEWDLKSDENFWSDELWSLYGIERRDDIKPSFRLWTSSIHPEDRQRAISEVTEAAQNSTALNIEYRVCHKDGTVHWLMSRGKRMQGDNGVNPRYVGTVIDITERKEAEIALKESKMRFNFALKATGAGIWEWDVKADKVTWSEQIWALYGLKPNSITPSHRLCESNVHSEDKELTFEHVMSAASRSAEFTVEYRVTHPDGSIHWLMCRGVPLADIAGQTRCYLGMVMDVTERRKAEEAWNKGQAKLNLVLQKSQLGIWDLSLNDVTAHRSLEHAHIFGYDDLTVEWTMERFFSHVVPQEREMIEKLIYTALEKQENYTFECQIITAKGQARWIWVFGALDSSSTSKARHVSGIVQDITDRKRTELLLKESEQKFRNIFEFSPIAICIQDMHNEHMIDVNASWLKLFGFSRQDVIGKKLTDLGIYNDKKAHEEISHWLRETGRISNRPFEFRKKSGSHVNILYSAEYVMMNGQTSLLVMMTDITIQELQQASISQLEKAVAERTEQLELEVEHLHRFLSMISHEYRTPLAIIRGNLDLIDLKHRSGDYSNTREMGKIKRAIDRLVEVMEVSIQESRILESQKTLASTNFEIEQVISSQLDAFRAMWPERRINYSGNLGDARVSGEASLLKMAIFNLLDNALKYSIPASPIEMNCRLEADDVVIAVSNQGKSINGEEGEEFFEKYRRGNNAANTGGAGIGLWLVKSIIDQHHGKVSLAGTESGAEATIRLPRAHESA